MQTVYSNFQRNSTLTAKLIIIHKLLLQKWSFLVELLDFIHLPLSLITMEKNMCAVEEKLGPFLFVEHHLHCIFSQSIATKQFKSS